KTQTALGQNGAGGQNGRGASKSQSAVRLTRRGEPHRWIGRSPGEAKNNAASPQRFSSRSEPDWRRTARFSTLNGIAALAPEFVGSAALLLSAGSLPANRAPVPDYKDRAGSRVWCTRIAMPPGLEAPAISQCDCKNSIARCRCIQLPSGQPVAQGKPCGKFRFRQGLRIED